MAPTGIATLSSLAEIVSLTCDFDTTLQDFHLLIEADLNHNDVQIGGYDQNDSSGSSDESITPRRRQYSEISQSTSDFGSSDMEYDDSSYIDTEADNYSDNRSPLSGDIICVNSDSTEKGVSDKIAPTGITTLPSMAELFNLTSSFDVTLQYLHSQGFFYDEMLCRNGTPMRLNYFTRDGLMWQCPSAS
ncbi:hypothetical protein BDC45DRAFT_542619 [Circinella umbellata]|nr:hypothetical protein BDC45DRAFT_542619 [Circinella umbellata]